METVGKLIPVWVNEGIPRDLVREILVGSYLPISEALVQVRFGLEVDCEVARTAQVIGISTCHHQIKIGYFFLRN